MFKVKCSKWSKHCPPLNKILLRIVEFAPAGAGGGGRGEGGGRGALKGSLGRGVPPRPVNPDPV